MDELLKHYVSIEAFDNDGSGTFIYVSESELGPNLFDLSLSHHNELPPHRTYTGEKIADIKAILQAEGFDPDTLKWEASEED